MKIYKYGSDSQQYGQFYKPHSSSKLPVVIVIHGGYWKDNHSLDSYPTIDVVNYVKELDVAVWNLEYRRMNAFGDNKTAPWPAIFLDVIAGVDFLKNIEIEEKLDLSRVMVIGHSAGGHLATWVASREMIEPTSVLYRKDALKVHRLISISGVLDLQQPNDVDQPQQIKKLVGAGEAEKNGELANCNPNQLHDDDVKTTIIHGDADETVHVNQALSYTSQAGQNVKYVSLPDAGHFDMLPLAGSNPRYWRLLKSIIYQEIRALKAIVRSD